MGQRTGGKSQRIPENRKSRTLRVAFIALFLAAGVFLWGNRAVFERLPFPFYIPFSSPTNVFAGNAGGMYVIENGKKEILRLDEKGRYTGSIRGGGMDRDFYYASLVCDDAENNVYAADVVYDGRGTKVSGERIFRFEGRTGRRTILYEFTYKEEEMPFQYGRVLELSEENGKLSFLHAEKGGIARYVMDRKGGEAERSFFPGDFDVHAAAYDRARDRVLICTRQGQILALSKDGLEQAKDCGQTGTLPWTLSCREGAAVYADLSSASLRRLDGKGDEPVIQAASPCYTVQIASDGGVYTTDYAGIFYTENGRLYEQKGMYLDRPFFRVFVWGTGIVWSVTLFAIVFRRLPAAAGKIRDRNRAALIGMVLCACLCIAVTVSALVLRFMLEKQEEDTMRELDLFSELLLKKVDAEGISRLRGPKDYRSAAYQKVKEPLDDMIEASYGSGIFYYYVLYRGGDGKLGAILDYEDTLAVGQPVYEWGDNVYTAAVLKGEEAAVYGDVSAYGTWSFVLRPVWSRDHKVSAVLETGINMDAYKEKQKELLFNVAVTVAVSVVVIVMFLLEVIFWMAVPMAKRKRTTHVTEYVPLRTAAFLMYAADSLQDAFIVQLCHRLWRPSFPIGQETAAGLPVSAQLFMAAVFSFLGGRLIAEVKTGKSLTAGFFLQAAGFFLCAATGGYAAILFGKALMGAGMGISAVTLNSLAAMGDSEEERGRAFAGINAGILGGITAGAGLGSLILSFGGYRFIFAAGAVFSCGNLLMTAGCRDVGPETQRREHGRDGVLKFLSNRQVWAFFLLLLIPFMIMIYYREYFFPLYAQEHGMSEVGIGRLFLVCGLIIIYAGPALGNLLLLKLGGFGATVLSSLLLLADVALFMVFPGFWAAVCSVLLLSVILSFAYTCQNAYFSSLPPCRAYGEGKAMGVYSMMDNTGQTLGPILFGMALKLGYTAGIRLAGGIFGGCLAAYLVINKRERSREAQKWKKKSR